MMPSLNDDRAFVFKDGDSFSVQHLYPRPVRRVNSDEPRE